MQRPERPLICSLCHQIVAIETSKTDEDGTAVHEDCYLQALVSKPSVTNRQGAKNNNKQSNAAAA